MMESTHRNTSYYAILSGGCAAMASVCGKLSGLPIFQGSLMPLRLAFFALMIISNGGVWTLYAKALQSTDSSLSATILSAASNYFLSAVVGFVIFGEITSLLWWSGMALVLLGLLLIARDETKSGDRVLQEAQKTRKNR